MTMSSDLVAWLRAQLDVTESETRKLLRDAQDVSLRLKDPTYLGRHVPGWYLFPDIERILARTLADLDAQRRVLDVYEEASSTYDARYRLGLGTAGDHARTQALAMAIRMLASVYADQPGYRDEWRPR